MISTDVVLADCMIEAQLADLCLKMEKEGVAEDCVCSEDDPKVAECEL